MHGWALVGWGALGGGCGGVTPFLLQRLCWHHPGGGDLLRAAGFHPNSEPGSEDVRWVPGGPGGAEGVPPAWPHPGLPVPPRCLEALLLGGRGPCVLADTAELPTLADIQLAHLKLRALCLPGKWHWVDRGDPQAPRGAGPSPPLKPHPMGSRCSSRGEVALGPGGDTLAGPRPVSRGQGGLFGV